MPADIAPSPITAMTLLSLALEVARDRHAEPGRDRGRGMRGAERVVFALGALGEAGEAAALAQRADAVAPAGQNLVRIGLMADVPDEAVARRVEHVVQRDRQFDDAETGAEMAAGDGDGIDRLLAQFVGKLTQLARLRAGGGLRAFVRIEQGRFAFDTATHTPSIDIDKHSARLPPGKRKTVEPLHHYRP